MISDIDGVEFIRFTSPHPLHMDDKFLEEFASNDKICKSIHMPLQSGNDDILKLMKRGYTKKWFLNRVAKLKELVPDVTITTDIIVGFPQESDDDFEDTISVVKEVLFLQIFNFIYSPRENTKALFLDGDVDKKIASKRLDRLIKLQQDIQNISYKKEIGQIHSVLFDELKADNKIVGRSNRGFLVFTDGSEELLGRVVDIEIVSAGITSLVGKLCE
jgi:tRNA-2-methylthio-N6-dimethylallyladenosine synthase